MTDQVRSGAFGPSRMLNEMDAFSKPGNAIGRVKVHHRCLRDLRLMRAGSLCLLLRNQGGEFKPK